MIAVFKTIETWKNIYDTVLSKRANWKMCIIYACAKASAGINKNRIGISQCEIMGNCFPFP